jgi:hypothetical protein
MRHEQHVIHPEAEARIDLFGGCIMKSFASPVLVYCGPLATVPNDQYTKQKQDSPIKNPGGNGHNPPIPPKKNHNFDVLLLACNRFTWWLLWALSPRLCGASTFACAGSADLDDLF